MAERITRSLRREPGTEPPPDAAETHMLAITERLAGATDVRQALHEFLLRCCETLEADRASIFMRGDEPDTLHIVAASDEPELARLTVRAERYPEVAAVLESTEPLIVEDAPHHPLLREVASLIAARGLGSLLVFPVPVDGGPRGALLFRRTEAQADASAARLAFGRVAAATLGLALSSVRFREAIREQTNRIFAARLAEERRIRTLERIRDLFESSSDGTVVLDSEGRVVFLNRAGEKMTGYSREGLIGRALAEIVSPGYRDVLREVVAQTEATPRDGSFDLGIVTTSGDPLAASVSVGALLSEPMVTILHFRDVTQARLLELELRRAKEFVEKLIDSAVDAVVAADMTGTIILFNKAAETLSGHRAEAVLGRMNVRTLYSEGTARKIMTLMRSPQHGGVGRLRNVRQDILSTSGQIIPVLLSASIVYEEGAEVATIGMFSDLRERMRIEEHLRLAQEKLKINEKQSLVAQLAGTTAHELNQPLTSILGYVELLRRRVGPDDPHRSALDTILREVERMAEIVRKIGRITRYETMDYVGGTQILDLERASSTSPPPERKP